MDGLLEEFDDDIFNALVENVEVLSLQTTLIHSQFEVIHPFVDENGRVRRLAEKLIEIPQVAICSDIFIHYKKKEIGNMGSIQILYKTKTGFIKKYVDWITEAIACQTVLFDQVDNVDINNYDIIPICPNCHMVLHSKQDGIFSIEGVWEYLRRRI